MPCEIKNPANIDLGDLEPHIHGMYDYFDQKIGFEKPPTMVFDSDPSNQHQVLGKTAYYDPSSLEIHVYSDGRHPKDMLRSIAHELIHHRQNLEGRLDVGGYHGEGYYLENKELKKLEHEAMLEGNALMREYEDTLKRKEKKEMSLNEWKNNELNRLLMKKFGILKEDKSEGWGKDPAAFTGTEKEEKEDTAALDKGGALQEDSGEDEAWNNWKNEHADDDHIKEIERHLRALKSDRDYERDEAEYDHDDYEDDRKDEHRNREDKCVGHDDRCQNDRMRLEEDEASQDAATSEKADDGASPEDALLESRKLKENIRKVLKSNKKLRLRLK